MKDRWSTKERRESLRQSLTRPPPTAEEEKAGLRQLREEFSGATQEERVRFLKACNGDLDWASKELKEYLEWRAENNLDSEDNDAPQNGIRDNNADWSFACSKALSIMSEDPEDLRKSMEKHRVQTPKLLPHIARVYYDENGDPLSARNGTMIVQVLSAQVDKTLGSNECYALVLAFYLDRKFDRASLAYGTLLIDVRGEEGWPNPSATHLIPFVKEVARMLPKIYPERLSTCLVYPVPWMANFLWGVIKPLLSEAVAGEVNLVNGSSAIGAPCPEGLSKHVDEGAIDWLEKGRQEA